MFTIAISIILRVFWRWCGRIGGLMLRCDLGSGYAASKTFLIRSMAQSISALVMTRGGANLTVFS